MHFLNSSDAVVQVAGIPIVRTSPHEAAMDVCAAAASPDRKRGDSIHLVNAYNVVLASKSSSYASLLGAASANLPDGRPLTWWQDHGGQRLFQVRGPQLFEDVISIGREHGLRHFLLGATEETLELLQARLRERFPGAEIVGSMSPPFRRMTAEETEAQDQIIRNTGAHIVWVGLGTPKQDWEVARIASSLPVVCVAVGAAFDFSAGTKKVAPTWVTALCLEWSFRLFSEPRRLWKRYLIGNLQFLRIYFQFRISKLGSNISKLWRLS